MNKYRDRLAFPFVSYLFLLFLLVSCEISTVSPIHARPTADNIIKLDAREENITKPDTRIAATATLIANFEFDCTSVNRIELDECEALVALYDSTNGPKWVDNNGWLALDMPCSWSGIECVGNHVSHINLSNNQLTGSLPPELGDLSHLRVLALGSNRLYGPIPAKLFHLRYLQTFSLAHNQFSGSIPSSLGNVVSLESLDLSHNQFSGVIPAELGNLANLRILYLSHNELSSNIPASLGNLSKLDELDLSYNQLRGAVPESITFIDRHMLWGNQLNGTITGSGQVPIVVDYEGVHFSVDPSLATSIWPEMVPATPLPEVLEGPPYWLALPEHIRITFANPNLSPGRGRMGFNLAAEAQLLVFPLAELTDINPLVQTQIDTLRNLLAERGTVPAGELPLLPLTNSAQVFHAQAQYLDFDNIQGFRFISQHTQDPHPIILSQEIFYTFQGFTDDNAYYVAFFFPLTTAVLPDKIEVDDWDAFHVNYDNYLSATTAVLDQLPRAEFTPDLSLLDAVVTSLRLEPGSISYKSFMETRSEFYMQD